ncbi:G-protein alpha subunit, putative [Trichomonas vaginalis G3]|uniref:G-protein alpha subunit, putative n=1 Tax=Trichomonas vaginalis (strain ATCC PRA-98 / G3) TaxID=412133 RepID=A2F0Y0_TRIV3|nr:G-protein beta/gamma-subunit complex binding [Trichomonas vaginalis G3]EAY01455.1 G-protein alpha subunit, putative [Trichomonas vaginalis G3]KAI5519252.1 G-protein beta/gamma-subunit complex binding [Trichomonas vaginalis G3]|eukprot:XP_001330268.1 G-protein alpha subunit [Trichomonas vaginalis G3]
MGCGASKPSNKIAPEPPESTHSSVKLPVETDIKFEKGNFEKPDVKAILLGAGESGKSTISRQLKRLYCGGFTNSDRHHFKNVISIAIISDFKLLIDDLRKSSYSYPNELDDIMDQIKALEDTDPIDHPISQLISRVWEDPSMKRIYEESNSVGIAENFDYFLNNISQIAESNYVPSDLDILKARIRTTGNSDLKLMVEKVKLQLVDIGGQKNERKHWESCFSHLNYIIFVQALSEFDQVLFEDKVTSRVADSLAIWDMILSKPLLTELPIFLVFNKKDLFETKLKKCPDRFKTSFPEFNGDVNNIDECLEYVKTVFLNAAPPQRRNKIFPIFTCAMDECSISKLINTIGKQILIDKNLY